MNSKIASQASRRRTRIPVLLIASPDHELRRKWGRALWASFSVELRGGRTGLESALRELKPSVLLLDLEVRRLGGSHSLPAIQKLSPTTKIIILTRSPKPTEELAAIKQGAKGYIHAGASPNVLRKAVNAVRDGEVWAARKIVATLIEEATELTELSQPIGEKANFLKFEACKAA